MMNIKKASEETSVSADTIRYYERIDVMQQALDRLKYKIANYDSHMLPSENKLRDFDKNKAK